MMPPRWKSPYDGSAYEAYNPSGATLKRYGITKEQYATIYARQGGCCGVCGEPLYRPHIDHDHKTNYVRGLLCGFCNTSVLAAIDSGLLQKAYAYLRRYRRSPRQRRPRSL